ncbi:MAG: isoprenyl transferase [Candidatus Firestonebacteria bacterium]
MKTSEELIDKLNLPKHIAIIMDGNGRWAKSKGLPRILGHRSGAKAVREIVTACAELKIKILTLYAFSVENWNRPKTEVRALMMLLEEYLKKELKELNKNNIRLIATGRIDELPDTAQNALKKVSDATSKNTGLVLNLALNYGGRAEIIDAINKLIKEVLNGKIQIPVDEEIFKKHLYNGLLADPDLLIRTSGEMRVSNFLLWQIAYTEIYVTDVFWPDFNKDELIKAILDYQQRERRFGRI